MWQPHKNLDMSNFLIGWVTIKEVNKSPANFQQPQITNTQQQILSFSSEGGTAQTNVLLGKVDIPSPFLEMGMDGRDHSITSFLSRPINLVTNKWTSADTIGAPLYSLTLPSGALKNAMYTRKLDYLLGLRCDFHIRVQVNAQPFHAGRLMLSWVPFLSESAKGLQNRNIFYTAKNENNLTPLSGCPRTEIDLSSTTEASITVPYISPFSFYHLPEGKGNFGRFQLVVYSPLVDLVASGEVDYTVWINMSNIKAEFPTGLPMSVAQIGNESASIQSSGVIESTANKISSAVRLFRDVPLVSNYTVPVAWASDRVADIAKIFGWSKPLSTSNIQLVQQNTSRYMSNYDGIDMSANMGFSASNEIEQTAGFYKTNVDEMSIAHIVRTPNYYAKFDWAKKNTPGTELYSCFITPAQFSQKINDLTIAPTQFSYVARSFLLWRGGLNFTFKFVKTKFHSGRIRILFVPGLFDGTKKVSDINIDANYSTVVDLRSDTDVTFNVPFVSTVPWLQVNDIAKSGPNIATTTGRLFVVVLNELVSTSTVSDTVQVLVEVAGAEDVEFAIPVRPLLIPSDGTVVPASTVSRKARDILFSRAQVGTEEGDCCPQEVLQQQGTVAPVEVANHQTSTDFVISANTVGEKITSVRQLIKRFNRTFQIDTKDPLLIINPMKYLIPVSKDNLSTQKTYWEGNSTPLDYFSYLFAFHRGSSRYKIATKPFVGNAWSYLIPGHFMGTTANQGCATVTTPPTDIERLRGSSKICVQGLDGFAELQIPYYSLYPFSVIGNSTGSGLDSAQNSYRGYNSLAFYHEQADSVRLDIYRAAGDDFSFGFLLGAPFVITSDPPASY
uniref:Structural polyprotein n=1 Tax=Giant panda Dicistroviridae TaxID=2903096 RepID=A0A8K1ZLQ5_9VIRU|nr:MAG: hypothetical protein 2 [Giant panda Dicistroviridae]